MKRSKPLRRGKPLERTRRLRSVSPGRRRSQAARRAAEAVLFEQRPCCWFDGETGVAVHGHELLSRSQGGSPERPDALLCNRHNAWCEDNPAQAAWWGWKVSRKHPAMPCIESGECRPWDHSAAGCSLPAAKVLSFSDAIRVNLDGRDVQRSLLKVRREGGVAR